MIVAARAVLIVDTAAGLAPCVTNVSERLHMMQANMRTTRLTELVVEAAAGTGLVRGVPFAHPRYVLGGGGRRGGDGTEHSRSGDEQSSE